MFKKPFSIGQSHKVSGADRKKLRRALEKAFGVGEEGIEALLPAKSGDLECVKLASPSRVVLYMYDGQPILFDPNGKGDFVPTIFALWRLPTLLPQVYVKHPAVSRYTVGGADLMLPGVLLPPGGLPNFEKEQLVAICSPGNAAPVAVGTATMSATDAVVRILGSGATGPKGKLVELLQYYGDYLWSELGAGGVPNEGFLSDGVVPVGVASVEATLTQEGGPDDGGDSDPWEGGADDAAARMTRDLTLGSVATTGDGDDTLRRRAEDLGTTNNDNNNGNNGNSNRNPDDASTSSASGGGGEEARAAVDMDSLLQTVLLQALHKSVKDADLPLNSSALWNQHLLPVRPAGSTLDVKKSKHKKMSKFLQLYGKLGLLTCKEDKHSGDVIVTSINRNSLLYTEYRPYKASATAAAEAAAATGGGNGAASATGGGSGPAATPSSSSAAAGASGCIGPSGASTVGELRIEELYKPGKELRPIFGEIGLNPEALYSAAEAGEVVFGYVKAAGLEQGAPDNRTIVLNPILCDALFKGLIKKGETYPTHLAKADLREAFLRRMHLQCRISKGQQQVVRKGQPPAVQISTEKRQGNKRVTKVVGLEPFLVDLEQVAGECQRRFACSTNVVELPGKGAGHEVVLQGSFVEQVADFIMQQHGIPKKYFQVKK